MSPPDDSIAAAPPTTAALAGPTAANTGAQTRPRYLLHLGLFLATCVSTTFAGTMNGGSLGAGLMFAGTLLGILVAHEMGHYVLARRHGVDVSLPYFIPLPIGIGTLGAVIKMRGRIPNRDALVDIGAAGPLAGLVVAIPLLIIGVGLSPVADSPPGGLQEGNSLLYVLIKLCWHGFYLPSGGHDVQLHPIAFGAWVGILVTFINLIPIGQLDGGHVAYGLLGHDRHERFSRWLHAALLGIGVVVASGVALVTHAQNRLSWGQSFLYGLESATPWGVWAIMIALMRRLSGGVYHPPVAGEGLTLERRRVAIFLLITFVLIFTPVPMREVLPIP